MLKESQLALNVENSFFTGIKIKRARLACHPDRLRFGQPLEYDTWTLEYDILTRI